MIAPFALAALFGAGLWLVATGLPWMQRRPDLATQLRRLSAQGRMDLEAAQRNQGPAVFASATLERVLRPIIEDTGDLLQRLLSRVGVASPDLERRLATGWPGTTPAQFFGQKLAIGLLFLRCGLQYRYQNGSALPPSRPVQMWFGEFIHGVMETAYRLWQGNHFPFPWPCTPTQFNAAPPANRAPHDIGTIGDLVELTLAAAGKSPRSRDLRNSAYRRAVLAVNEIAPPLFPLITAVEERVVGTRLLPPVSGPALRAQMYELHGVMDVLSSVGVAATANNIICDAVRAALPQLGIATK